MIDQALKDNTIQALKRLIKKSKDDIAWQENRLDDLKVELTSLQASLYRMEESNE